ncbi:MAG TPA: hypothetical protein VF476_13530 [Chitinophagaceae bacterium]
MTTLSLSALTKESNTFSVIMSMKKLFLSLFLLITGTILYAQDTLPKFSVKNVGNNRMIISWNNNFEIVKQISIQRSVDSLKGYKSILTVPDPSIPQNGYVDTKAPLGRVFYRLYILLDKGVYLFSDVQKPVMDTTKKVAVFDDKITRMNGNDSISIPNFGLNSKNRPEVFTPSVHVYTYNDGNVRVNLPDDENRKFSLKFFEEDDSFIFELKDIKERTFRIDKANFYHAGWFKFELYEDGKLKEKHKFVLQKDF